MVSLVIFGILLGCGALLYVKGTLAQGLIMVLNAVLASLVAFAYFEQLATLLIKYSSAITPWAQTICFLLLFVLAFAVLQSVAMQLCKQKIDLGLWPERVGRAICGLILGYLVAGQLLVAGAMAPLPNAYPYERFDQRSTDASTKPNKALFNPDGFVVGLFGTISKGSFGALGDSKSFAMLHAGYLDELYLNRLKIAKELTLRTRSPAIEVPRKGGVWDAPSNLKDSDGQPVPSRPGESLMLVRLGIKKGALQDAGKFTLSQVRLVCRVKGASTNPLSGKGQTVYPEGYIGPGGQLVKKRLTDEITIRPGDVPDRAKDIDLAFYVPAHLTPALIGFKLNNLQQVSTPASGEDAPQTSGFRESSEPSQNPPNAPAPTENPGDATSSSNGESEGSGLSGVGTMLTDGALEEDMQL
jgi:hypothetical protein